MFPIQKREVAILSTFQCLGYHNDYSGAALRLHQSIKDTPFWMDKEPNLILAYQNVDLYRLMNLDFVHQLDFS